MHIPNSSTSEATAQVKSSVATRALLWAAVAVLSAAAGAQAAPINVIDVIPVGASGETGQSSEPSIAVNPTNPMQMVSGAFSSTPSGNDLSSPFWMSTNGGTTWTGFGSLPSSDKTLAWRQDGVAPLATTLNVLVFPPPTLVDALRTFQGGASNFGSAINDSGAQSVDQPWLRTGPGGQTYLAYNGFNGVNTGGKTASIQVSSNNGVSYGPQIVLETVSPAGGQDAPSVRTAVNGSTVYAAFTRWGSGVSLPDCAGPGNCNTIFPGSGVVVVKSTDSGATFNAGTTAATTTGYFSVVDNTSITLGQERTGSDVAIAVDPNNASRVIVAYGDAVTGTGALELHVVESTDGGSTWTSRFTTSSTVRSGLPALTILANGAVGLLYQSYDPGTDQLSQHLLTTTNDFGSTSDTLLGTETNALPLAEFDPYLGDFFDMTSVGDTLYGIFSASNADNGILTAGSEGALYPDVSFQRDFIGTPGTASFALKNLSGGPVDFSIDPFVFSETISITPTIPEPATLSLLGAGLFGLAAARRRRRS